MKKKPIYLLCAACLAWSCTNDPTADPAGLAGTSSGELVPVSLELRMTDFAAPPTRATQNIRATAPGGGTALVDAEISAPQPASRTRTGGSGEFTIPDDQKVFRLDILQFNGTGTQGFAGQQAQILNQAGYAGTSAANADGWATQTSTVFYEDPRMEGTAKDVAAKLGISNVRQESGLGDPDIVVVLR